MKKRILPLIFTMIVCLTLLQPMRVDAVTPLDPDAQASLTLHYRKDGAGFPELQIGIYRIAEALPNGTFELIEPFSSYPISIHDITAQEQWQIVAQTLHAYIIANQVQPDREELTDENGTVCFSELKTGLYFVREAVAENENGTYVFNQFLVYVPTPREDGSYNYAVEANPKCTEFTPRSQYTVKKLWQDAGNQGNRPNAVTIDIYHDGILYKTVTLNAENNWTYTWQVSGEDTGKWTVSERSVPEGYKVTIRQDGHVFSVINTSQSSSEPPKTGDTFALLPWTLAMCFSGMMMLILGICGRRKK